MNEAWAATFHAATTLGQAGGQQQGGGILPALLPLILIVVVMYFLMIRPQQKKQKAHQALVTSLKPGDEVVTAGGLYGTVAGIDEKNSTLYLKISGDIKVRVERHAIARVIKE
ncbi:preprotein translocase subunit YajC [bacterium]|nr:preprotein translocase subunit YajC [bacterium]MBU1984892.1 preprotein translocase subunit YajC [bacterium]